MDRATLEATWLHCLVIPAQGSRERHRRLKRFLRLLPKGETPFTRIVLSLIGRSFNETLKACRLETFGNSLRQSLFVDLETGSPDHLRDIGGVTPDTIRRFLYLTRPEGP